MTKKTQRTLEEEILNCKKRLKELAPDIEFDEEKSKEYNKIMKEKIDYVSIGRKEIRYKENCYEK